MDGEGTAFTVREERNRGCDSIRALALACPYPIHRRRTAGDRQQRGRKGAARCSSWTEKLPIRRFRLRWRTCRRDVQPDRIGQAERSRSGVLPAHCLVPDPGPPHQPHRGAPALGSRPVPPDPVLPGSLPTTTPSAASRSSSPGTSPRPSSPNPPRQPRHTHQVPTKKVVGTSRTTPYLSQEGRSGRLHESPYLAFVNSRAHDCYDAVPCSNGYGD